MKKLSLTTLLLILLGFAGVGGATYLVVTSGGQTLSISSLNKGLIAHYPLSSESMKSSTVFADTTMHGYDGTITAGASEGLVTDQHGNAEEAYDFDGADTKIDTGSDWIGAQAFTISAWIYADGWGENNNGYILSNRQSVTGFSFAITSTHNALIFTSNPLAAVVYSEDNSITLGSWYHVVVTRNTSGIANLYINGEPSGNGASAVPIAGEANVFIGNKGDDTRTFDGKISDLRVYNRVLSTDEITLLYNSYKPRVQVDCAGVIDSDGQWYDAIKIGDQCWMAENMNAGIKIDDPGSDAIATACTGNSGTEQTIGELTCYCTSETEASCQRSGTGGTTQKYCYDNTESYCTSDGALYEWQEAMDLSANCSYTDCSGSINTPHQGICPNGWHIPTDTEWKTLEGYLGMSVDQQNTAGWRGTNEGDKLKVASGCYGGIDCNSSRFSSLLTSYRRTRGSFTALLYAYAWSSSQNSSTHAWIRHQSGDYSSIYRNADSKNYGFPVRCLKN